MVVNCACGGCAARLLVAVVAGMRGNWDGIPLVGCTSDYLLANLPHTRFTCPATPFTATSSKWAAGRNSETCSWCYCYICDRPAAECPQWTSLDLMVRGHCNAHGGEWIWKRLHNSSAIATGIPPPRSWQPDERTRLL